MGYVANTLPYFAYTHRCKQNTLVCYQNTPWAITPLSCNTPRAFFFNSAHSTMYIHHVPIGLNFYTCMHLVSTHTCAQHLYTQHLYTVSLHLCTAMCAQLVSSFRQQDCLEQEWLQVFPAYLPPVDCTFVHVRVLTQSCASSLLYI